MKRFLLWAVIVVLFIVVLGVSWWIYGDQDPTGIPVELAAAPKPNARDYYVKAGHKARDLMGLADAARGAPLSVQRAVLRENAGALQTLQRGLRNRCLAPVPKDDMGDPEMGRLHTLAQVLALQQRVQAESGDWKGAVHTAVGGVKFGQDQANGGAVIGMLLSVACQSIARREVWPWLDHLDGKSAWYEAHRLEGILNTAKPLSATIQSEKDWSLRSLARDMHKPDWQNVLAKEVIDAQQFEGIFVQLAGAKMPEKPPDQAALARRIRLYGKRYLVSIEVRYDDGVADAVDKPYASKGRLPDPPSDPLHRYTHDFYPSLRFQYTKNLTANRLLLVGLALRAYKAGHNGYPQTLAQLSPKYLREIPQDPFALNQPLRYRRSESKHVLYSLGPDGRDDDGRPALSTRGIQGMAVSNVGANSVGDFVAGVNF